MNKSIKSFKKTWKCVSNQTFNAIKWKKKRTIATESTGSPPKTSLNLNFGTSTSKVVDWFDSHFKTPIQIVTTFTKQENKL